MENTYEFIVNLSQDFITLINRDYVYEVVNDTYCSIIEKTRDEVIGKSVADIWGDKRFNETIRPRLDDCFKGKEVHYIEQFEFGIHQKYMHVSFYPYGKDENITHALVYSHDITKLGEIESKLINYEYRDPLTGLFNKRSMDIILDMELEKARRSQNEKTRSLLFVRVDNLAEINRKHGHEIGDILLENTGIRIKEVLRNSDYVFRFEGNELVILLTSIVQPTDAAKVAGKITDAVSTPYKHDAYNITLTSCIGIANFPEDGETRKELIQSAVAALAAAKEENSPFKLYDSTTHHTSIERLKLENDMLRAFDNNQFELYYQPLVNTDCEILGAEALIRWHHPDKGLVPPNLFIPLAEETGIIEIIGRWAIFAAAKQFATLTQEHEIYVSVNLSAREFRNPELPDILMSAIKASGGLDPNFLKLEITESESFSDPQYSIERMKLLNDQGIELLIDDFGTGQSSLSYLKNIPANIIKIDKVFVDNIVESELELDFLERIIGILKSRGKKIVVEGVASPDQFEILKQLECDYYQGFHFSKPLTVGDLKAYLKKGT